jgi:hypothetical protein
MKKLSLLFVLMFLFISFSNFTFSQLLTENFDYPNGDQITDHGWFQIVGVLTPKILVGTSNGLTYTNYANSGIGNAAIVINKGESVYKTFTAQSSSNLYVSFLVNVTTPKAGDYFLALLPSGTPINFTSSIARVFVAVSGSGWKLGLSKGSETVHYGSSVLAINTTYLVVIKYTFNTGSTTDDQCTGYVFTDPILPSTEGAATAEIAAFSSNTISDAGDIGSVALRQGGTPSSPILVIDGIRVGTTWGDAPLPVELSSFTCTMNGRDIQLNWGTKTEKNSDKFVIERKTIGASWEAMGSVKAAVLSNSPKNYSYSDTKLQSGKYQYRLKMVDNDGSFSYSSIEAAEVAVPKDFAVSQNYPNPFNPSTKIDYQVPVDAKVILEVYNIAGQKVSELVNQEQSAGYYTVDFGASKLSSGIYIYRIVASDKATGNNFSSIKKMMLLK